MASKRHRMSLEQRLRRKKRRDRKVVSMRSAQEYQLAKRLERSARSHEEAH